MPYIENTIFEDDKAILRLIDLFELKEVPYKLTTTIEGVIMEAKMGREIDGKFKIDFDILPELHNRFEMHHFFEKPIMLVTSGANILVENVDVTQFRQTIEDGIRQASIWVDAFRGDLDDENWNMSKQSAYFRYDPSKFEAHRCGIIYDMTTNVNQDFSAKNCVKIEIDKLEILFYYIKVEEKIGYFVVKTNGPINHSIFVHFTKAVRAAFSLTSGFYFADSVYFFTMKKGKKDTLSYRYENFNESIHTARPLLDSLYYNDIPQSELYLNSEQFEQLVKLLFKDEELLRSCILLVQASCLDSLSKGCLAAVALETITNRIIDKNKTTSQLIEDKKIYKQLHYELRKGLKKIKNDISKSTFDKLSSKIGKLNEQSNSNKLSLPFDVLDISIDEEELYCISCRNNFLHGSLPSPTSKLYKSLTNEELLKLVSNKLIMLSAMLLFKKIGYSHNVIDWGITEIIFRRMMMNGESLKGAGRAHRLISD